MLECNHEIQQGLTTEKLDWGHSSVVEYAQHVVSQDLTCHTGEKQKEEGKEQKKMNKGKRYSRGRLVGLVMSQQVKVLVQAW